MLDRPKLINIRRFLERVTSEGAEALAWAEVYQAVEMEIRRMEVEAIKTGLKASEAPEKQGSQ